MLLLHLFGCLNYFIKDARSHKHQIYEIWIPLLHPLLSRHWKIKTPRSFKMSSIDYPESVIFRKKEAPTCTKSVSKSHSIWMLEQLVHAITNTLLRPVLIVEFCKRTFSEIGVKIGPVGKINIEMNKTQMWYQQSTGGCRPYSISYG